MPRLNNRLIFLILGLFVLTVVWSCSQPDDVLTGIANTRVTLSEERLPTLPDSMAYELWVANDQDSVSLGKFLFDHATNEYLTLNGEKRSNEFMLNGDIYDYDVIFVSVETNPDDNTASPGPKMLIDEVTNPSDNPIDLIFPEKDSLWRSTAMYNMKTVSDDNVSANAGSGIWFTSYQQSLKFAPDTILLTIKEESTLLKPSVQCEVDSDGTTLSCDTINKDVLYAERPYHIDSIWYETTLVTYGQDTLLLGPPRYHIGGRMHQDSIIDSVAPWYTYKSTPKATLDSIYDVLDIFAQGDLGVPNLSAWHWHYKGWVVSPYLDTSVIAARLAPPAWPYQSLYSDWITGDNGALISTGSFYRMNQPDWDGNPFAIPGGPVPTYPGEEFLNAAALLDSFGIASVNLMPLSAGNVGTVFITLEPDNYTGKTNFPLFAFVKPVPSSRSTITSSAVRIDMTNWTQALDNDLRGFPKIKVSIERF